jgi:hypothetical protein
MKPLIFIQDRENKKKITVFTPDFTRVGYLLQREDKILWYQDKYIELTRMVEIIERIMKGGEYVRQDKGKDASAKDR